MIAVVIRKGLSCDYHRLENPLKYMDIRTNEYPSDAITVIFSRHTVHNLARMKREGRRIIMDIDDYWHLYPEHYLFSRWDADIYIENLKLADVVTCTNEELASRVRIYNNNVVIIPNALPFDDGQFCNHNEGVEGNFGYVGGASHALDVKLCPDAKIPPQIDIDHYMSHYRKLSLSYAPLMNNEFNRCKSNLKALESGVNYSALMASNIHPYLNSLDKDCVILVEDGEWASKIKYCRENPGYVKEMGIKLGEHVRKHYDLRKVNELRKQVWLG